MNATELTEKLASLPAPRVTEDLIKSRIQHERYLRDDTSTICVLVLDNGFKVFGHSTPASPENFREDIGRHYAYEDAFKQLWRYLGFLLVEIEYHKKFLPERESQP